MSVASKKPPRRKPGEEPPTRRKSDDERRGEIMKVLATAGERAAFQAAADAAGMSLSTWLRHVAIKALRING